MSAIVIQADSKSNKILSELAKKLGGKVLSIDDNQYEDIALGTLMDMEKTGKTVSRDKIMKKLNGK
jgi:Mg-chelatase subunit ChlD